MSFPLCYSHEIGSVFVYQGTESHAAPEGGGHVGDGHIPVSVAPDPAPLLQSLHGRHPGAQRRTDPSSSAAERL